MADIGELLNHLVQKRASDLHLKAGSVPCLRINNRLERTTLPVMTAPQMAEIAAEVLPTSRAADFDRSGEADFAVGFPGVGRFRISMLRQRGTVAIVFRRVATTVPSFDALGFPQPIRQLAELRRGLVLVTGPADSGKSTTIGSILNHINENFPMSIVTVEDPIEILHADQQSFVSQREVGTDTANHYDGFTRSLRHDPDVIYVDRISDGPMMDAVLTAATGRLVISTMNTLNAAETIAQIVDFFPPHMARQTRHSLAAVLEGVISQRLLERQDGRGRIAAFEMMVATPRIHDSIVEAPGSQDLETLIAAGEYNGMRTMDQHLLELHRSGAVGIREALSAATHPRELRVQLQHVN
jgi:twitching motility protein PilT